MKVEIDSKKCIGCGVCINYCPVSAISMKNKAAYIDQTICRKCKNVHKELHERCNKIEIVVLAFARQIKKGYPLQGIQLPYRDSLYYFLFTISY